MQALGMYPGVLVAISAALLLIVAGIGKDRLVGKQGKAVPVRARRRP